MADNKDTDNRNTINKLQKELKNVLEGMNKLDMPDAEITSIFYNILERISNSKSRVHKYKDALFRMLFGDKKEMLSLYNALNDSDYDDPELLQIMSLDKYWFISIKNDVAFAIMSELYIIEQQYSICNNMPLRSLFYITETFRATIKYSELYMQKTVKIPAPHVVVFYNGSRNMKEDKILMKLSDSFEKPPFGDNKNSEPEMELKVHVYNINKGHNEELLAKCPTLKEYMQFINIVRTKTDAGMGIDRAVANAINYGIEHGILSRFLKKNRDEVMAVMCAEYTFEDFKIDTDIFIQETIEQMNELKEELDGTKAELDGTKAELDGTKAELDGTKAELDGTKAELDGAKAELDGTKAELENLTKEIEHLRKLLAKK